MSTVRRALRHPGTWLGFVGVILLVAGAYALPTTPQNFTDLGPIHQWWWHMRGKGRHLQLVGGLALGIAFLLVRPESKRGPVNVWTVFALWTLPLLVSLPLLSPDLYSYLDYSWILHQGQDPYQVGLGTVPGPYSRVADPIWKGVIAVYPALDLRLYQAVAAAAGYHVIPSVLLGRLPALAGAVITGLCIPRLARWMKTDVNRALWLALLNPVTLITGIGAGHNDMLMTGLVVFAIWLAIRGRYGWIACAVVAGLACGIKQPGLVAALTGAMIATHRPGWGRRIVLTAASLAIAAATFVATSLATGLGFGWVRGLSIPGSVASMAPVWAVATMALLAVRADVYTAVRLVGYAAMALGMVYVTLTRWRRPLSATVGILALYALLSPNLHAWYLLPVFVLVGLIHVNPATRAAVAGLMLYLVLGAVLTITYQLDTVFVCFLCADLGLVLAWFWLNRTRLDQTLALPAQDIAAVVPAGMVERPSDEHAIHDPVTGEATGRAL